MNYMHNNQGTCSRSVSFTLENGKISNINFTGGCPGNLSAISKLCDGMDAKWVAEKLRGNTCGMKPTSCGDQLARAIETALEKENRQA